MHLQLTLTSEDFDQFTEKIISKYQPLNNTSDPSKADRIDKQIQEFAQKLCGMYQKFYPVVCKTHYQHGMYLSLINHPLSNVYYPHQDEINEDYRIFREHDVYHWTHIASTTFEALLMNFRKLIIDTSRGKGKGKAISMKKIRKDIMHFHTSMKANSGEFTKFVEDLDKQIKIATAPEREKLWDYILAYNIHLQDKFSTDIDDADTDDPFHVSDLEILMNSVNDFINAIYSFYNYKEPTYKVDIGYDRTQDWIQAFSSFKKHSMRYLSQSINALALLSTDPEYMNLTPEEASKKIFEKEILENETNFEIFALYVQGYLKKRIEALKDELNAESDL